VNLQLEKKMIRSTDKVFTTAGAGQSLRQAAFDISVKRVARAAELRGYV
jgi:glutamate dehydrogenase/leucine dehydrogenase